jgi:hypothetical protein
MEQAASAAAPETMKSYFLPQSKAGRWSVGLAILMPILFAIGASLVNVLYESVPAGGTILQDLVARPALVFAMLAGMAAGIAAFITGVVAISRQHERALPVYAATTAGLLLILFLAGEFLFPE